MSVQIPRNLLPMALAGVPIAWLLAAAGAAAGVAGYAIARVWLGTTDRLGGPAKHRPARRTIGRTSIFAGPTASAVGSLIGYVLAGTAGAFVANPVFALGVGVAHPAPRRLWGAAAANRWTGTFLAGWASDWTTQVTGQFTIPYLPHGTQITVDLLGNSIPLPIASVFGYIVGVGVGGVLRLGGTKVALGSTSDTARAGIASGGVWLIGVALLWLALVPAVDFPGLAAGLFGIPGSAAATHPAGVSDVLLAIMLSLFLSSIVVPFIVRNQRSPFVRFDRDSAGKLRGIDLYSASLTHYVGVGATSGAIFTLLISFGSYAGLANTFSSWATLSGRVAVGVALSILLSVVVGRGIGYPLMRAAVREIEQGVDSGKPIDEMDRVDPYLLGVGSLLFGIVAAISLTGAGFYAVEWYAGALAYSQLVTGALGGLGLAVALCAVFRHVQRSSLRGLNGQESHA